MKKIGIIGGLSPESTMKYYQWLNEGVRARLGGSHSAKIILSSVDFAEFVSLKNAEDWETQGKLLAKEAVALEQAGAEFIVLATNTMHKMADKIEAAISVPFLHLADATAKRILEQDIETVGLLGTRYTMEEDFYVGRLAEHGIKTIVPDEEGRKIVNDTIYNELTRGIIDDNSRIAYSVEMKKLAKRGAQGIIMGCTEITMLVGPADSPVPLFDTTKIHVEDALEIMFSSSSSDLKPATGRFSPGA